MIYNLLFLFKDQHPFYINSHVNQLRISLLLYINLLINKFKHIKSQTWRKEIQDRSFNDRSVRYLDCRCFTLTVKFVLLSTSIIKSLQCLCTIDNYFTLYAVYENVLCLIFSLTWFLLTE